MKIKLKTIAALFFLSLVACKKDDGSDTVTKTTTTTTTSAYTMHGVARIEAIETFSDDPEYGGDTITLTFNNDGRIDTIISGGYGNTAASYEVYTYDANGNIDTAESFNSQGKDVYSYTYENGVMIEITEINLYGEANELIKTDSLFWSNGLLDSVAVYFNGAFAQKKHFTYDDDDNLIQNVFVGASGNRDTITYSNFVEYDNLYGFLLEKKNLLITGFSIDEPTKHYENYQKDSYRTTAGVTEKNYTSNITYSFEENEDGFLGKVTKSYGEGEFDEMVYNYTFK